MLIQRSFCLSLVVALLAAVPTAAQEVKSAGVAAAQEPTPGVVIVGHGPDVPNAPSPADGVPDRTSIDAVAEPPVLLVFVPVPILVQPARSRHHHPADAAAEAPADAPSPPNPFGRFINDPSHRFINPPAPPTGR